MKKETLQSIGGAALLAVLCSIGLFFRQDLFGFDSYASWLCIKGNCSFIAYSQPLALFLFDLFPDSLLFFKIVMLLTTFASLTALIFIAKHFFEEKIVWISLLLLCGLSPLLVFNFGNFENEIFAFPLLFWGFYFAVCRKSWWRYLSILFFGVAALFWQGSIYFVVGLVPLFFELIVLALPSVFFYFEKFVGHLVLNGVLRGVMESRLFSAFFDMFGLVFVIPFIFRHKNKWFWLSFFIILFFVAFNSKFVMLLVPFLLIGISEAVKLFQERMFDVKNAILPCFFMVLCWNIAFSMQQPTKNDWVFVDEVVKLHESTNYPVYNDWSFGYWIKFKGIDTNFYGGPSDPIYKDLNGHFIALTQQYIKKTGCELVKEYVYFAREARIYVC